MSFEKEDLVQLNKLKKIVLQSTMELKGNAVTTVAATLLWMDKLEEKIESTMKLKKPTTAKPVKKPIKKVGE